MNKRTKKIIVSVVRTVGRLWNKIKPQKKIKVEELNRAQRRLFKKKTGIMVSGKNIPKWDK